MLKFIRFLIRSTIYAGICLAIPFLCRWLGRAIYGPGEHPTRPQTLTVDMNIPAAMSTRHKMALYLQSHDIASLRIAVRDMSEAELIEALECDNEWAGGKPGPLSEPLLRALAAKNPQRAAELIMLGPSKIADQPRWQVMKQVYAEWTKHDARAAYAFWMKCLAAPKEKWGDSGDPGSANIFPALAKLDLADAFAKFRETSPTIKYADEKITGLVGMVRVGIHAGHREQVFAELMQVPPWLRIHGVSAFFTSLDMKDLTERAALIEYANKEPDPTYRQKLLRSSLTKLHGDPASIETLRAFAKEIQQTEYLHQMEFAEKVGAQPISEAAQWYLQQPVEKEGDLSERYVHITEWWSKQNLNECGTWLNAQPSEAPLDQARRCFAIETVPIDPTTAFDWIAKITDPTLRLQSAGTVATEAPGVHTKNTMQTAIQASSLTAEEKAKTLEVISQRYGY